MPKRRRPAWAFSPLVWLVALSPGWTGLFLERCGDLRRRRLSLIFDLTQPRTYVAGGDPMAKCSIVELQVQDRPVHLIVDTGLQGMVLYEERLRKSVPGLRTAGSTRNATMGGRVPVKQATLPDVRFGNRNREVQVAFLPSPAAGTLPGIDGIVGIAALQAHRVHFDFSTKTLTWE
jgi:hypothetical protein